MLDFLGSLNWIGGMVGGLLSFIFGALWYSPLLMGNLWLKSIGKSADELKSPLKGMLLSLIYIVSYAFLIMTIYFYVGSVVLSYVMVVVLLVVLTLSSLLHRHLFEGKSRGLFLVHGGQQAIMTIILATSIALI